ncbi:hypothetical protein BOTBODRAFT_364375 [Botryobasidium botryosum FD-172 SS1]|uniref:Uncharacterized protein n=1 Tax=Botryobasidium botryosum (strain FD-172 SS1) TaxID=930990 RepID=A0A067MPZ5_BOTB1|nr:hypothetical protein BOTBODRAFT_364375 [Botryobasidium botryosum FD-172 SS1]
MTVALIVPAIIQKHMNQLTLHHATLVLNYATFSTLISLAISPLCTVWYADNDEAPSQNASAAPKKDTAIQAAPPSVFRELWDSLVRRFAYEKPSDSYASSPPHAHDMYTALESAYFKHRRSRIILASALLIQTSLLWAWAFILFTNPRYSQKPCNGDTKIVFFFGATFTAHQINHGHFAIWPIWLLFSLLLTLVWGGLLVVAAHKKGTQNRGENLVRFPENKWYWIGHFLALLFAVMYIAVSETQIVKNHILPGELNFSSFGSVAALLLAIAPSWTVVDRLGHLWRTKVMGQEF